MKLHPADGETIEYKAQTSRYGVAVIQGVTIPAEGRFMIQAYARDAEGHSTNGGQDGDARSGSLRIELDKALYRATDPVRLRIKADASKDGTVYVAVHKDHSVLDYKLATFANGEASIELPPRAEYEGLIAFHAYLPADLESVLNESGQFPDDTVSAWFRPKPSLSVSVIPERTEYRPGDPARVTIAVTSEGKPVEAAIGLAVVDHSIEARAESSGGASSDYTAESAVTLPNFDEVALDPEGHVYAAALAAEPAQRPYFPTTSVASPAELYRTRIHRDMAPLRRAMNRRRALGREHPNTLDGLKTVARTSGIELTALADPWGSEYDYLLRIERETMLLVTSSAGPDREPGTADDITHTPLKWNWFEASARRIAVAIRRAERFPRNELEFRELLRVAKLEHTLRDPDGKEMRVSVRGLSLGISKTNVFSYNEHRSYPSGRGDAILQTITVPEITLLRDNATLGTFLGPPSNGGLDRLMSKPHVPLPRGRFASGSIEGKVIHGSGSGIHNALVEITSPISSRVFTLRTGKSGEFRALVPEASWAVRVSSRGFTSFAVTDVPVVKDIVTEIKIELGIASAYQQVDVEGQAPVIETQAASLGSSTGKKPLPVAVVRNYFPETLAWMPMIETGPDGKAQVDFALADSITTWKMNAAGSSRDGRIGETSSQIRAFQPFFVDVAPPAVLTVGDEIALPVAIYNYGASTVAAATAVEARGGLEIVKSTTGLRDLPAGESLQSPALVRAARAFDASVLRATVIAGDAADAVERTLRIRTDGREEFATVSGGIGPESQLTAGVPETAIPGGTKARLRIYPTLLSHIYESRDAILTRPWGCGEQTISSTFPNLLMLQLLKPAKGSDDETRATAARHLRGGYDRLLGYQVESGGFSYFYGEADAALTAYAIEFLSMAAKHVDVDPEVVRRAVKWLWSAQSAKGSWEFDLPATTALVAARLAEHAKGHQAQLLRAVTWLENQSDPHGPYELASLVHIYAAMKNTAKLTRAARALAALQAASATGKATRNTPFHGWGRAGNLETAGVAISALQRAQAAGVPGLESAIRSGVQQLLQAKDQSGTWHSGQATVRVLQAIAAVQERPPASLSATVSINGKPVQHASFSGPAAFHETEIAEELTAGKNTFDFVSNGSPFATASVNLSWNLPWLDPVPENAGMQLAVSFDRVNAAVGDSIQCSMKVTRSAVASTGMLIAEIGLPPGAEVERSGLDALRDMRGTLRRYELQPDRVVLYLWPPVGPQATTEVQFAFRPRYALKAKSAPSVVWDYYNPDFRALAKPVVFTVLEQ